MVINSQ